ncbi:MAG: hypothetical protein AAGD09_00595 [Cyanobacteria bacterium P01_F01_bin.56]
MKRKLTKGEILYPGDKLYSNDELTPDAYLTITPDGDLQFCEGLGSSIPKTFFHLKEAEGATNSSSINSDDPCYLILQEDGNLCIRTKEKFKWANYKFGDSLTLFANPTGEAAILHKDGEKVLWVFGYPNGFGDFFLKDDA